MNKAEFISQFIDNNQEYDAEFLLFLAKLYQTINWEKDINHFLTAEYLFNETPISVADKSKMINIYLKEKTEQSKPSISLNIEEVEKKEDVSSPLSSDTSETSSLLEEKKTNPTPISPSKSITSSSSLGSETRSSDPRETRVSPLSPREGEEDSDDDILLRRKYLQQKRKQKMLLQKRRELKQKEYYFFFKKQNKKVTDIIKDIEETFVEQQNEIDQVRFNNDRKRYLDFRYQIHQNYDILTRNVYLMCKIQKGFDITADLNYFFGEEEEENNPSEEYDELEEYQSRKYNPNRSRYDTKQRGYTEDEDEEDEDYMDLATLEREKKESISPSASEKNLQLKKTHFQKLKYRELHQKYDPDELSFFNTLNKDHQGLIYQMEKYFVLTNQEDIPLRFRVILKDIPLKNKASIVQKMEDMQRQRSMGNGDHKYQHWLHGLLKIPFGRFQEIPVQKSDGQEKVYDYLTTVNTTLDKAVYGHQETKQQIIQLIAQWVSNPKAMGNVIGIQGPMGNGKTTLVRYGIAEALKRPFHFISLGGASDASYLDGHSYTYEGSTWGRIVDVLIQSDCMNPVFYFDELDKVSKTHRGEEIMNLLIHLTDPTQNNKFQDKYFSGIDIDLSRSVFIFSYNDISKVNPILLDRLYTVKTEGFKTEDKLCIVKDYLLPSLLETQGLEPEDVSLSDEVIRYLITEHTEEEGVRSLKKHLGNLLSYVNIVLITGRKELLPEKLQKIQFTSDRPIEITKDIVDTIIKSKEEEDYHSNLYL